MENPWGTFDEFEADIAFVGLLVKLDIRSRLTVVSGTGWCGDSVRDTLPERCEKRQFYFKQSQTRERA